tara:strand:- start:80 stop:214 length:135 start_codon:yes stop_codon:yes gene_type:complete
MLRGLSSAFCAGWRWAAAAALGGGQAVKNPVFTAVDGTILVAQG